MAKEMVAMLLAGGKGTRLEDLTKKNAKPAVSFGGKYRIIDFPLSNCANSRIDTVGVLTQYESVFLNTYVGNGEKWGLNGVRSLTASLPPRQTEAGAAWYRGTADAIYQNLDFLDSLDPEYVLILSGDHVYKMDYREMLEAHKCAKANLTIAVLSVTLAEASRFGIMNVKDDMSIYEFEEKPKKPKSTLASMGIYIFNYRDLKHYLVADAKDETSEHDFGKNIIPTMLNDQKKLLAFQFKGYWKDVGTIDSLWQANMDMLEKANDVEIYNMRTGAKTFSEDTHSVPQYVGKTACVTDSIVNQGAIVLGKVNRCVIFNEVLIDEGAVVTHSVIMPGAVIGKNAVVDHAIVAGGTVIEDGRQVNVSGEKIALVTK